MNTVLYDCTVSICTGNAVKFKLSPIQNTSEYEDLLKMPVTANVTSNHKKRLVPAFFYTVIFNNK